MIKKLYLFFHMATMNGEIGRWQFIYNQIKDRLTKSGLLYKFDKIFQYNLGKDKSPKLTENTIYIDAGEDFLLYEFPTLIGLKKYCDKHDGYVLYIHSKGVSQINKSLKSRGRNRILYYVVDKWEECVKLLEKK